MPILSRGGAGLGSSSDIGDLNAPGWKSGGPTSGAGAWGEVDEGEDETLILGYTSSTGTAGFARLECTGDTAAFKLVSVEGEDLDSPATFTSLTNSSDYMYIAFKGTASSGNSEIEVKIEPVMIDTSAKSMTITVYDHEGESAGTLTATFTYSGRVEINLTEAADIDNATGLVFGTGGVGGALEGLKRSSSGGVWGTRCHSVREVTSSDHAYIEVTPTVMSTSSPHTDAHHWMVGFGYVDDFAAGTYGFEWMTWNVYCWGGGPIAAQSPGGTTLTDGGGHPSGDGDTTLAQMAADRSLRIYIEDDDVTLRYSDDDWETETTFWTFAEAADIAGNSNLVAGFAIHDGSGSNVGIIEGIKLFGLLTS